PWVITKEGKIFYNGCLEILEKYFDLERTLKCFPEKQNLNIKIASIYYVGLRHMKNYVQKFTELYPHVNVNLTFLHPHKVYESVVNDWADFGIVSFLTSQKNIKVIPWREEKMVIACYPEHPLAKRKKNRIKTDFK
ncbi:hypothetical protein BVX93_00695, partial [bacterium B13(2017)]